MHTMYYVQYNVCTVHVNQLCVISLVQEIIDMIEVLFISAYNVGILR